MDSIQLDLFSSIDDVVEESIFKNKIICIAGQIKGYKTKKALSDKLKALGALKVDYSLTRKAHYLILGSEPAENIRTRYLINQHDGLEPIIIKEDQLDGIFHGASSGLRTDDVKKKNLHLTLDHYNWDISTLGVVEDEDQEGGEEKHKMRVKSPVSFADSVISPFARMEVYLPAYNSAFAQIIGNLGGFASNTLNDDTDIIILSDDSYLALKEGHSNSELRAIEDQYNSNKATMFNIQFTNYSEVLAWVKNRAEITGDEVLKGLVAAL